MLNGSTQIRARRYLAAAKEPARKSHAVISKLEKTIEEEEKRLAKLFKEKVLRVYDGYVSMVWIIPTDLCNSKRRDFGLKDTLIKIILDTQQEQMGMRKEMVKHLSKPESTKFAIYHEAKSNIASSRDLLMYYERASQQVAFSKWFLMMEFGWEKGSQTLQHVLDKQGEKIKAEIHQLLDEDPKHSEGRIEGDMSKTATDLWDRFAVGETKEEQNEVPDGRKGVTWGVAAKNAQRGVRRAVKHL